ncbi:TetR/AcrR family transcriptional regulator [Sphingomonas sp. DBB INV C78]|uniref:TetR/AcrR family transcriptional regulator n=1 Tax=Sphingomonas sp. DBB INV C78 TaxID=3349434 RepID=UPI0036D21BB1
MDAAVRAAVAVFREHGFEGTSAQMLVSAMGIGRQSLYDTFGDKWGIYLAAVKQYSQGELRTHAGMLMSRQRAVEGIRAMLDRVAGEAHHACLGVSSTVEFGCSRPDLVKAREASSAVLVHAIKEVLAKAKEEGDVSADLDLDQLTTFLIASISSIRLAARGGAGSDHVSGLVDLAMRALR